MAEAIKSPEIVPAPQDINSLPFSTRIKLWSRTRWGLWTIRVIFFIILIGIWQALFNSGIWKPYILPSPPQVATSLGSFDGAFLRQAILSSLVRLLIGYGISVAIGLVLGLLIGSFNLLKETFGSVVLGLQALPSICWLPLAILWLGLNDRAIIFVVVMGSLFSITLSVDAGVRNIQPIYVKAAKNMGARGLSLYTQVIFPAAFPTILNGLKQGWSFAWRSLMSGELLYTTTSLGLLLETGQNMFRIDVVMAVMIVIIIMSVVSEAILFAPLERVTRRRWGLNG